ncbi:unnamed protein product [Amoebophrya sp. A25]|nr:unnamed protein product [Amoebophrya sp. A25]|eukprot:GSA25T00020641001.1
MFSSLVGASAFVSQLWSGAPDAAGKISDVGVVGSEKISDLLVPATVAVREIEEDDLERIKMNPNVLGDEEDSSWSRTADEEIAGSVKRDEIEVEAILGAKDGIANSTARNIAIPKDDVDIHVSDDERIPSPAAASAPAPEVAEGERAENNGDTITTSFSSSSKKESEASSALKANEPQRAEEHEQELPSIEVEQKQVKEGETTQPKLREDERAQRQETSYDPPPSPAAPVVTTTPVPPSGNDVFYITESKVGATIDIAAQIAQLTAGGTVKPSNPTPTQGRSTSKTTTTNSAGEHSRQQAEVSESTATCGKSSSSTFSGDDTNSIFHPPQGRSCARAQVRSTTDSINDENADSTGQPRAALLKDADTTSVDPSSSTFPSATSSDSAEQEQQDDDEAPSIEEEVAYFDLTQYLDQKGSKNLQNTFGVLGPPQASEILDKYILQPNNTFDLVYLAEPLATTKVAGYSIFSQIGDVAIRQTPPMDERIALLYVPILAQTRTSTGTGQYGEDVEASEDVRQMNDGVVNDERISHVAETIFLSLASTYSQMLPPGGVTVTYLKRAAGDVGQRLLSDLGEGLFYVDRRSGEAQRNLFSNHQH